MKRIILLAAITLLSTIGLAQVRRYQKTQEQLLTALQNRELSQEDYISMTSTQLSGLKDSVHIQVQKPHYNAALDLAVIGGGVMYQKFGNNVKYDYILHGWGGYFGSKAIAYGLDRMGCSKTFCALGSFLSVSLACFVKESIDSRFDNDDLIAGMGGAALASLSYTIDLEKLFKK